MRLLSGAVLTACVVLTGCAATVNRGEGEAAPLRIPVDASKRIVLSVSGSPKASQSSDWADFRAVWRDAMQAEASAADKRFNWQDGNSKPGREAGTLLQVQVEDYRYVSTGARYGLGAMTGNAYVNARVRFVDARSGAVYGERSYNTSSTAWQGIFSAMTAQQVQAICKELVSEVRAN
ncbi:hypothetical protein [Eleftheria terrae]|uniref:hypothetical protein n=1 Tax=Eleftheria terrae TaxID=1597781 RepID=UPI00263B2EE4|nr:hypothetical protein [Eleftheria terrae]WKB51865.1 hypothetical protein N7L95_18960 [Eleftheria terrae]